MEKTQPVMRATAAVIAFHCIALVGAFFVLAATFEFPAVLRLEPLRILELFQRNEAVVVPCYYVFTLTGVSFMILAVLLRRSLASHGGTLGDLSALFGVLAGFTQAIGFVRWVFFVPAMSATTTDPGTTPATRDAALVTFQALHQFAGVSVGENLSFLFQGLWTITAGLALSAHPRLDRRLGMLGVLSGSSFIVYTLEQFGGPFAILGELNAAPPSCVSARPSSPTFSIASRPPSSPAA